LWRAQARGEVIVSVVNNKKKVERDIAMEDKSERAPYCYHCATQMEKLSSPPVNLKSNLDWEGEFLWICVNNQCPVFVNGFHMPLSLSDEIHLFRSVVDPETGACAMTQVAPFTSADLGALLHGPSAWSSAGKNETQQFSFLEEDWNLFPTSSQ